jgi:hypothetical protein
MLVSQPLWVAHEPQPLIRINFSKASATPSSGNMFAPATKKARHDPKDHAALLVPRS